MSVSSTSTVRSLEVWFGDGDVVLQADDSLFKVHGKTLRQHSFVLDQMLEDSDEEADRCDGCPVVPVRDAGGDMSAFLRFMYTPSYRPTGKTDAEVKDLISVLHLSTKYRAPLLRQHAIDVFTGQFPATLNDWDARTYNVHFERNVYAIANALRDSHVYSLLPTVLLHCCLRLTANMLLGMGTAAATQDLDTVNEQDALLAQSYLSGPIVQDVFPDFFDFELEVYGCHNVLRCCRAKAKLTNWIKASPFMWCYATSTMESSLSKFQFCQTCSRVYMKSYAEGRQKIWDELPQHVSLPAWPAMESDAGDECSLPTDPLASGTLDV